VSGGGGIRVVGRTVVAAAGKRDEHGQRAGKAPHWR
jgi:hypothetical protein